MPDLCRSAEVHGWAASAWVEGLHLYRAVDTSILSFIRVLYISNTEKLFPKNVSPSFAMFWGRLCFLLSWGVEGTGRGLDWQSDEGCNGKNNTSLCGFFLPISGQLAPLGAGTVLCCVAVRCTSMVLFWLRLLEDPLKRKEERFFFLTLADQVCCCCAAPGRPGGCISHVAPLRLSPADQTL